MCWKYLLASLLVKFARLLVKFARPICTEKSEGKGRSITACLKYSLKEMLMHRLLLI